MFKHLCNSGGRPDGDLPRVPMRSRRYSGYHPERMTAASDPCNFARKGLHKDTRSTCVPVRRSAFCLSDPPQRAGHTEILPLKDRPVSAAGIASAIPEPDVQKD